MLFAGCVMETSGSRMLGIEGRRYKLWWLGKRDIDGGMSVKVKELCEAMKVRRVSDSDGSCVGF